MPEIEFLTLARVKFIARDYIAFISTQRRTMFSILPFTSPDSKFSKRLSSEIMPYFILSAAPSAKSESLSVSKQSGSHKTSDGW